VLDSGRRGTYDAFLHLLIAPITDGISNAQAILIHSAAEGAGIAAIQVAKITGARIFATVGIEAKEDMLVRELGLARENIFFVTQLRLCPGHPRCHGRRRR
jgi:NADPH:quinone reductase-like Zn-dependent oxidoreductase